MTLTPEERAEKIIKYFDDNADAGTLRWGAAKATIEAQIREAVLAEYEGEDSPVSRIEHAAYDSGYSRATEEAAKIAYEISFTHCAPGEPCTGIGQAIREAVKEARNEDWKEWLKSYRSMNEEKEIVESTLLKCGKEIGKRVSDQGWMNILPAQFELAKKEAKAEAYEDAATIVEKWCLCKFKSGETLVYLSDLIRARAKETK